MRPAAEAVIKALFLIDVEAWGFLVMKRAATPHLLPRPSELDLAANHVRQPHTKAQFIQKGGGKSHRHGL